MQTNDMVQLGQGTGLGMVSGWGDAEVELAKKLQAAADEKYAAGQIDYSTFVQVSNDAAHINAMGIHQQQESKSDRLKSGLKKVGTVIASTAAGLVTSGPAGAAAGFAAGARGASSSPTAIAPVPVESKISAPSAPSLVDQSKQASILPDTGDMSPWWLIGGLAVAGGIIYLATK